MAKDNELSVSFGIEEVLPDGQTRMKEIRKTTLESADPATDKLERAVITGKVTGNVAFETTIEQQRGIISIGGRVTDPGTLTKNPIRFTVRVNLTNVYSGVDKEGKKKLKAFEKKVKGDRVDFKWTDGDRYRSSMDETVDVTSKEVNGPGISLAEIKMSCYGGRKLVFGASGYSSITLSNDKPAPLYDGFTLRWLPDDPPEDPLHLAMCIDPEGNDFMMTQRRI